MSSYHTLLRVAVEHSYNSSGVCPCLDFYPTEKTKKILANAGLLLHQTDDGIQIVYDETRLEALELLAQDQTEEISFDFKVHATDSDFRSYSEPYSGASNGILYFDNLTVSGPDGQLLSLSNEVSTEDFRPLNASEFEALLTPKDRLMPPEFVLRIFTGDQGSMLRQWLAAAGMVYSVRFKSRQRYWKYYLLGKMVNENGSNDAYRIVDPDNKFKFEAVGEEKLSDQRIAYTFRSRKPIPLNEHYQYRFQLQKRGQNGDSVLIPNLPFASVKQVGADTIAEQAAVVSEIYINS